MNIRNLLVALVVLISFLFFAVPELTCQTDELKLDKITNNLYMFSGYGGNVTVLVTEQGVLVVDSFSFPYQGEALVEAVRTITDAKIKYLIYTHYHDDHILGAQSFPADTIVISHSGTRKNIERLSVAGLEKDRIEYFPQAIKDVEQKIEKLKKEKSPDLNNTLKELELITKRKSELEKVTLVFPALTIESEATIYLERKSIKLIHLGAGHTNGDLIVYFPDEKIITMGDLIFNNKIPYIDREAGANTENWIAVLDKIEKMDIEKVIPGHGNSGDKKILGNQAQYLKDLRAEIQKFIKQKATLDDIKKNINLPQYKNMDGYDRRLSMNAEAVYQELTAK